MNTETVELSPVSGPSEVERRVRDVARDEWYEGINNGKPYHWRDVGPDEIWAAAWEAATDALRPELQQARYDLMVRETVKDERIDTLDAAGHRLALELECLLMDTKDLPTVSRWWNTANDAMEEWRKLFEYNGPRLGD